MTEGTWGGHLAEEGALMGQGASALDAPELRGLDPCLTPGGMSGGGGGGHALAAPDPGSILQHLPRGKRPRIPHPTSRTPRPAGSPGSPRSQQQPRGQLPAGLTQPHPQHDGHADSDSGRRTRAVTPLQAEPSQLPAVPRTNTSPRGPAAPSICPPQQTAGTKRCAQPGGAHTHCTHTHM